jgi:hypothetical protein
VESEEIIRVRVSNSVCVTLIERQKEKKKSSLPQNHRSVRKSDRNKVFFSVQQKHRSGWEWWCLCEEYRLFFGVQLQLHRLISWKL